VLLIKKRIFNNKFVCVNLQMWCPLFQLEYKNKFI
jgi:hypothetical protein